MKELIKKNTPHFILNVYHCFLSLTGAVLYRFPSRKLRVVGVTGTSGKSTVVDFTTRILEEAGFKVASLSSIKFKIDNKEWDNKLKMTMPGRLQIQKFLRQAANAGCKYVVLEVTSEGIAQHRHRFINFSVAVFTNLSPEHIESHGGFDNYRNAKLKLFKKSNNIHIVNLDDDNSRYFWQAPVKEKWGYGMNGNQQIAQENIIKATDLISSLEGLKFKVNNVQMRLNLLGSFNISNALAAICVGLSQGISLEICARALKKVNQVPGRMEVVIEKPFSVIVDYAHTPTALEKVYKTIKSILSPNASLICVLGSCGGGRDKWKRQVLGKLAADYCKEAIVTNEDPYDENPEEIMLQVAKGAGSKARKILDRRGAIREALRLAKTDDIVVVTGKGSEPWMCVADGEKIPWDDRAIVKEEFKGLHQVINL